MKVPEVPDPSKALPSQSQIKKVQLMIVVDQFVLLRVFGHQAGSVPDEVRKEWAEKRIPANPTTSCPLFCVAPPSFDLLVEKAKDLGVSVPEEGEQYRRVLSTLTALGHDVSGWVDEFDELERKIASEVK